MLIHIVNENYKNVKANITIIAVHGHILAPINFIFIHFLALIFYLFIIIADMITCTM